MNVVIGSGPAGVAAATALLEHGQSVTMLDAGGDLESEIQAAVDRLGAQPVESWPPGAVRRLKGDRLRYNSEGAPLKLAFGSDYVYRDVDRLQPVETAGVDAYRALAVGGLSALWGAAILPFAAADFSGWPFAVERMAPYYETALRLTGLAGAHDRLARSYPLYAAATPLPVSAQARFVLDRATAHAATLEQQGIHIGRARLALIQPNAAGQACAACGLCLYGCPYGLIYSAATTLRERLLPNPAFRYVGGVIVRRLTERGGRVLVEARSRDAGESRAFDADRVYLGAGALGSTAILLASLPGGAAGVTLRQSDHFLVPLLLRGFRGTVETERLHTLSQIFIELLDPAVSPHGVHLQLYTYSDFYSRMARERLGSLYPLAAPVVGKLLERGVVVKGYLHSGDSAAIGATLEARGESSAPVLRLSAKPSARTTPAVRATVAALSRNRAAIGATPIRAGLRIGLPGSGVHVGGSFPMRERPGELETDPLGRPTGFERVHVVDSSVFPTLPAAPPTLTVMANALRIASEAAGGEEGR